MRFINWFLSLFSQRKFCPRCRSVKAIDRFRRSRSAKDGMQTWCAECQDEYKRIYTLGRRQGHADALRRSQTNLALTQP